MKLWSDAFEDGQPIPPKYAFATYDPVNHIRLSDNVSPPLRWSDLPNGTKSLVLLVYDLDAPTRRDDANKEGRVVPADLPREPFTHWVLVDIPTEPALLAEGEFSRGVTPRGKGPAQTVRGTRHGLNNYTKWFEGDPDMEGEYYGYDGPCPPWNDSIVHRYYFTLYALDVERCSVTGTLRGETVREAISGRILGEATLMGTYKINPDAK